MPTKRHGRLLILYAGGHFLVDLACAYLMVSLPEMGGDRLWAIILYNFCAFAAQMPVGLIADRLDRNGALAAAGLGLCTVAFLCHAAPLLCAVVAGLGNCLYHVGGGVEVLHFSGDRQWMLGVFVSPGAVGLFIGTLLASYDRWLWPGGLVILALSLAVVLGLHRTYALHRPSGNGDASLRPVGRAPVVAGMCLFSVVILRSYVGMTLDTPWKTGVLLPVLAVLGLALGKTAGGCLADRFGAMRTAVVSLGLCAGLFLFSENAVCGLLAIFLFNMTMPLTLFAMAKLFPRARGFAFGTLTFALFLGCVPRFLSLPVPFAGEGWLYAMAAVVSLGLLAVGLIAARPKSEASEVTGDE